MCNEQTCVLRTSLSLYNFGRRFLGCSRYKVGLKCPFFVWVDNPTCPRENETTPLAQEKTSKLQSALQLANEREMTALEMAEEARQWQKRLLKRKPKPRKGRERLELSVQKLRKKPFLLKRSRECGSLHSFCHGSFLLLLCCCALAQLSSLE